MTHFYKIAITPSEIINNEESYIRMILDCGWDYVHLRHPSATRKELQTLIEAIPQKYHSRIKLHGHFDLLNHFNLGGVHLNRRCPEPPCNFNGKISKSCHDREEVLEAEGKGLEYLTLSPVFDSISKAGYRHNEKISDFMKHSHAISTPIIALGGITPQNINLIKQLGFNGFATIGSLFEKISGTNDLAQRLSEYNNV